MKTKLTPEDIKSVINASSVAVTKLGEKTTVVCVTLPNGFEIIESSSCVDPANYDYELGESIAMKRIEDKIWMLEGYLLQSEINKK
jgi:hypothetical protein